MAPLPRVLKRYEAGCFLATIMDESGKCVQFNEDDVFYSIFCSNVERFVYLFICLMTVRRCQSLRVILLATHMGWQRPNETDRDGQDQLKLLLSASHGENFSSPK